MRVHYADGRTVEMSYHAWNMSQVILDMYVYPAVVLGYELQGRDY